VAIRKILKFPDQDLRIKAKPVETFKPKTTESSAKKGIDAALDGLE